MNFDKIPTMAWYGLTWKQIEERGFLPKIEQHLIELTKLRGKDKGSGVSEIFTDRANK